MMVPSKHVLSALFTVLVLSAAACSPSPASAPSEPAADAAPTTAAAPTNPPATPTSSIVTMTVDDDVPVGLRFQTDAGVWRVAETGVAQQLHDTGVLLSPWGDRGIPVAPDAGSDQLPMLDVASGATRLIDLPGQLVSCFAWLDRTRVACGLHTEEVEGGDPNIGHLSVVDTESGTVGILDPEHNMASPPDASPDGLTLAFDRAGVPHLWRNGTIKPFDIAAFEGAPAQTRHVTSPAFSPDGTKLVWLVANDDIAIVVFDLVDRTARTLAAYEPMGFGGWFPAPSWSPDGRWLAAQFVTFDPELRAVHLLDPSGDTEPRQIGADLGTATWVDADLALLDTAVMGETTRTMAFRPSTGELTEFALPADARLAGFDRGLLPAVATSGEDALAWLFDASGASDSPAKAFIDNLETLVLARDIPGMTALAADPFGLGPYRSEWSSITPDNLAGQLETVYLAGTSPIVFSSPDTDLSAMLDGVDPMAMLGPDVPVVAVLHSSGWGAEGNDEAMLFVTEDSDGGYVWSALLIAPDGFALP